MCFYYAPACWAIKIMESFFCSDRRGGGEQRKRKNQRRKQVADPWPDHKAVQMTNEVNELSALYVLSHSHGLNVF